MANNFRTYGHEPWSANGQAGYSATAPGVFVPQVRNNNVNNSSILPDFITRANNKAALLWGTATVRAQLTRHLLSSVESVQRGARSI